jgi:hypothetical protein
MTDELIELNLKVAKIAGWTNIEIWNPHAIKKSYVGTNLAHPELGIHIPKYVESIDAIVAVFDFLGLDWNIGKDCDAYSFVDNKLNVNAFGETPAIALCKLLVAINPEPIKPLPISEKEEVKEDESTVIEASF